MLLAPQETDTEQLRKAGDEKVHKAFKALVGRIVRGDYTGAKLAAPSITFNEFQRTYLKGTGITFRAFFEGELFASGSLPMILAAVPYTNSKNTYKAGPSTPGIPVAASWRIKRFVPFGGDDEARGIAALGEWTDGTVTLTHHMARAEAEEAEFEFANRAPASTPPGPSLPPHSHFPPPTVGQRHFQALPSRGIANTPGASTMGVLTNRGPPPGMLSSNGLPLGPRHQMALGSRPPLQLVAHNALGGQHLQAAAVYGVQDVPHQQNVRPPAPTQPAPPPPQRALSPVRELDPDAELAVDRLIDNLDPSPPRPANMGPAPPRLVDLDPAPPRPASHQHIQQRGVAGTAKKSKRGRKDDSDEEYDPRRN